MVKNALITNLLFRAVLKDLQLPELCNEANVNILVAVRYICGLRLCCNLLRISLMLGYNRRTNGRPMLLAVLNSFIAAGYISGKRTGYKITDLGLFQLKAIEAALSRAKIRLVSADKLLS